MRSLPSKFLAVALTASLTVAFYPRAPEPDAPATALGLKVAAASDVVRLRSVAKEQIAREVAGGLRSLVSAAALFRELNRLEPAAPELAISDGYPSSFRPRARTDEERLCRQVVNWVVKLVRRERPEQADAVATRLDAEFLAERQARGAIRLPDSSSLESVEELLKRTEALLTNQQRRAILGPFERH
jgi:hypothetical protein